MAGPVRPEDLTDEMIAELRDSAPASGEHWHVYCDCVRALGTDPISGHSVSAWYRQIVREHLADTLGRRAINARSKEAGNG